MKAYTTIALFLGLSFSSLLFAQSGKPWINKALEHYKQGEMDDSREAIEKALEYDDMGGNAYAWHFKGFIYKELFKTITEEPKREEYRELAVRSVERSIELDIPDQFEVENIKALEYLAVTFQRESYDLSMELNRESLELAPTKFARYKSIYQQLHPDKDITHSEVDFYNTLGRSYNKLEGKSPELADEYNTLALKAYDKVLEVDRQNYNATINKGITIYNRSVKKIRAIDYRTEIFELIMVQDECVTLFRESLPFFQQAYQIEPKKRLPLQALIAVHKSLNDPETASRYEDILRELEVAGEIED